MRYLSLFSGALGLDLGLETVGWECLAVNEIDRFACETIRRNRPALRLLDGDVRSLTPDWLRREFGKVDVVVGGPPCQAFSTAGRRQSVQDPRGSLLDTYVDLALALRPKFIVVENVRGLLSASLRHRPVAQRGSESTPLAEDEQPGGVLRNLIAKLSEQGFHASFSLYDAAYFGAAQRRERVVLIAGRRPVSHLAPTHQPGTFRTFRQAVEGLATVTAIPLRPQQRPFMSLIPPGGNWRSLPPELQPEALGGAFRSSGGRVGFLRRLAWDKPAPALTTNPTMPATLLAHPEEDRPLSIEEYKRLQGFPDDWDVAGGLTHQYRQIGNAVPVELGAAIARHIDAPPRAHNQATSRYRKTRELDLINPASLG
jgi:DNA (cytosine-5)-methyltransferase 1